MNLTRLKFAYARGARIQIKNVFLDPEWLVLSEPRFSHSNHSIYRIHPKDEHLQYGPVSTAFRDMALFTDSGDLPEIVEMFMDMAGTHFVMGADWNYPHTPGLSDIEVNFCRLFFAEYLADEGL